MKRLVAPTLNAEVFGGAFLSLINNVRAEELAPILQQHGVRSEDIHLDGWYSYQLLMDIYRSIEEDQENVSENFVSIGMKIMEQAPFPPELKTLEEALASLEPTYNMGHRNHTERGWVTEFVGERHAVITAENPYPDDLCYGLLWALVRRFAPKGSTFEVSARLLTNPDAPIVFDVSW